MPNPTLVYNDNAACIQWSVNLTSKGLHHIQIHKNTVRENLQNGFVTVEHIEGKRNSSDLFTKEDKDPGHFVDLRNLILQSCDTQVTQFRISLREFSWEFLDWIVIVALRGVSSWVMPLLPILPLNLL